MWNSRSYRDQVENITQLVGRSPITAEEFERSIMNLGGEPFQTSTDYIAKAREKLEAGDLVVDFVNREPCDVCSASAARHELPPYHEGCQCVVRPA